MFVSLFDQKCFLFLYACNTVVFKRRILSRTFWHTTQNLLILAILWSLYKLLKCILELRNISKDKKIIIMKVGMLHYLLLFTVINGWWLMQNWLMFNNIFFLAYHSKSLYFSIIVYNQSTNFLSTCGGWETCRQIKNLYTYECRYDQ